MTIRIIHPAGVGDWLKGATVEQEDRRAQRLIALGYAVEVSVKKESKHVSTKPRSGV